MWNLLFHSTPFCRFPAAAKPVPLFSATLHHSKAGSIGCESPFFPDLIQIADREFLKSFDLREILTPHLLIRHHCMDQFFRSVIPVLPLKFPAPTVSCAHSSMSLCAAAGQPLFGKILDIVCIKGDIRGKAHSQTRRYAPLHGCILQQARQIPCPPLGG